MATTSASSDVKGINASGVSAIKQAIQEFVKGYQSKIANVSLTSANIQQAVKGSNSEKQIQNLSNAIKESVTQSLNKLNTFANQLDTVKSSYQKADSSNTSVTTYSNKIKGTTSAK